jgi:hypothetical protein
MHYAPGPMRAWLALLATAVAAGTQVSACSPNSVCKMGGPINDPSNRTLRRNIMSYGLSQFCQQMTSRSAPLELAPDAPVIGRFFPQHCQEQMMENGDLWVQFDGMGYAFTNLSRKVTFSSAASIRYDQDFRCADDNSVYAYFDPRAVSPATFHVMQIELPGANLVQSWITPYADNFGRQMVSGQLGQGFTVIQFDDGGTDFDVGHLPLGHRPAHPFGIHGKDRVTVESLRTQVSGNERDFIGPIKVSDGGRALYVTMTLDGQQAIEVLLMPKAQGDVALQAYLTYGPAGPLPAPPTMTDVVRYGVQYQRAVPVPPGMYYVVIDNTTTAVQSALPFGAPSAAVVDYAIQIGDAP